jgi:hypothetical protein
MLVEKSYLSNAACLPRRSGTKAGVLDCGGYDAAFPRICLDVGLTTVLFEREKNPKRTQIEKCVNACLSKRNVKISKIALKKRTQFSHPFAKMLPIVATLLPEMLPLKLLTINDVTDVTAFPTSHINHVCADLYVLYLAAPKPWKRHLKANQGYSRHFQKKDFLIRVHACPSAVNICPSETYGRLRKPPGRGYFGRLRSATACPP